MRDEHGFERSCSSGLAARVRVRLRDGAMKLPLILACVALTLPLSARERLPVETFAKTPDTQRMRLSPDGRHVAFLRDFNGRTLLHVAELATNKITRIDPGEALLAGDRQKEIADFEWVGNRRLVMTTTVDDAIYGVIAADLDGGRARPISGYEDNRVSVNAAKLFAREVIHVFLDADQTILMLDRHEGGAGNPNRPDILRVDTMQGLAKTVLKNPGEVASWGLDFDGVARVGILSHGDLSGVIYRAGEQAEWRTVLPLANRRGKLRPLGFDAAGDRVFVAALTPERRWTVYPMNTADGTLGEPLLADPVYDIVPERYAPSIDGVPLAGPVFSRGKRSLLGVRYFTESPRVKWFDPDYVRYQAAVDKALPDTVNVFMNQSLDGKRQLWLAHSDQHPGAYHLFDLEKRSFQPLAPRMAGIKPAEMAPMLAIKYPARDGLLIHGYLTVPLGHKPAGLPLVVMPHGGPWVRDFWGFNPLVQLLASRGYAVLQMNYRGSPGYGDQLLQEAKRQIGGEIQQDIEDATRWAIAAGVADARRIAIVGSSYGGYSALFALGRTPELYRCGISIAGVTDWFAMFRQSDVADYKQATRYWREQIGDPGKEEQRLKDISPVYFADRIAAPVLIIQGKEDRRVPPAQARAMIAALEKTGRKPESLFIGGLGHSQGDYPKRLQVFRAVVDFLEKNLGPGVE